MHVELARSMRLVELAGFDLDPDGLSSREAPDQDLCGLVVRIWSKQSAVLAHRQPTANLLLAPEADDPVLVGNHLRLKGGRRRRWSGDEPFGEMVESHQVFCPPVTWDRMSGHIGNQQNATTILDSGRLLLECGRVSHQSEGTEAVPI